MDRDLSKTSGNGRKFKRFMATLLSVAMIVLELPAMAVPTMAATKVQAASSEAVVTEAETNAVDAEANVDEAVNNETTSEEALASEDGIEEALEASDLETAQVVDGEEELESYQDVDIWFVKDTIANSKITLYPASISSNYSGSDKITDPDVSKYNASASVTDVNGATVSVNAKAGTYDYKSTPAQVSADGTSDTKVEYADSTRDFVFYMAPSEGYTWATKSASADSNAAAKALLEVVYTDYTDTKYADSTKMKYDEVETLSALSSEVTVEDAGFGNDLKKVTISKDLLGKVITNSICKDKDSKDNNQYAQAELAIKISNLTATAWKALPQFIVDGKAATEPTTIDRTFDWTASPAANTAGYRGGSDYVTIDADKYVTGKTITADMITLKYTPANGGDAIINTVATSGTAMTADLTKDKIGGTYGSDRLVISSILTNAFIKGQGNLEVIIDTSSEENHTFNVTATASNYLKITKNAAGDALESTIDTTKAYTFYVKPETPTKGLRKINKITVKTKEEGKKVTISCSPALDSITAGAATTVTIAAGSGIKEDIVISAETTEEVNLKVDGTDYAGGTNHGIFNTSGKVISTSDVISGKTLSFKVIPDGGKIIESVSYYYGTSATNKKTPSVSGDTYTTNEAVTDTITIVVTTKTSEEKFDATLQSFTIGSGNATIGTEANVYTGSLNSGVGASKFAVGTAKDDVVSLDQPYYFTIEPKTGYEVASVEYKVGATYALAGDAEPARFVGKTGNFAVYSTVASDSKNNIYLEIDMCASSTITAPKNKKVTVNFAEANKSITVPQSEAFEFSITPDDDVEIDKVYVGTTQMASATAIASDYSISTNSGLQPISETTYRLSASDLNGHSAVYLNVTTKETVSSGYTVKWAVGGETSSTKYPVLTGNTGSQELTLLSGETTAVNGGTGYLTATFNKTDLAKTQIGVAATGATAEDKDGLYPESHGETDTALKDIVTIPTTTNAALVTATASKTGTDTIIARVSAADTDNSSLNTKIYEAYLPVAVKDAYKDVKVVASDEAIKTVSATSVKPAVSNQNLVKFTLQGTHVRTGEKTTLTSGSNGVTITSWKFEPDTTDDAVKTKKMTTADNTNTYSSFTDTISTATNPIYVAGTDAEEDVKVKVTMKQAGDTSDQYIVSDGIDIVEIGNYGIYPELEITTGGKELEGKTDVAVAQDLEKKGSLTGADITLSLYKKSSGAFTTELNTKTDMLTAKNAGTIALSTDQVEYTAKFDAANTAADKTDYLTVTPGNTGTFKVSVNKAPASGSITTALTIKAKVKNYVVDTQTFTFDVNASLAKGTVYLKLDDKENKDAKGNIVQQSLVSSYYTAKNPSIVEESGNVPTITDGYRGAKFENETVGAKFVLPKESDFDATKIAKNRILVAWTAGTTYYYPGETIIVTAGETTIEPVWLDKYEFANGDTITTTGDDLGKGRTLYNGNLATKDDDGNVTAYTPFSQVATDGTDVTTTYKHTLYKGGKLPVVMSLKQNNALTEETRAGATTPITSLVTLKAAEQTDKFVSGSDLTLACNNLGYGDNVKLDKGIVEGLAKRSGDIQISAKCTLNDVVYETYPVYFTIAAEPGYTVSLPSTNSKTFWVNQQAADAKLTPELKSSTGGSATAVTGGYANYTWNWTSSDTSVVEVEASETTGSENLGLLTPKKAGTATISLTVTDAYGIKTEEAATIDITVKESDVTFAIKDPDDKDVDRVYVKQIANGGAVATDYRLIPSKSVTIGNAGAANGSDGKYVLSANSTLNPSTLKLTVNLANQSAWTGTTDNAKYRGLTDEAYVEFPYSINGVSDVTFTAKVPVSTYYSVTLTESDNKAYLTKDGKALGKVTDNTSAEVKVTAANQKRTGSGTTIDPYVVTYNNIDLSSYGAVYVDSTDPKEFKGWSAGGLTTDDPIYDEGTISTLAEGATSTGALNAGGYTLKPVFDAATITEVVANPKTITLSNELAKGETTNKDEDYATVSFTIEPYNTQAKLTLVTDSINFYGMVQGKTSPKNSVSTVESLDLTYAGSDTVTPTSTSKRQIRYVTFSAAQSGLYKTVDTTRRAGTANIKIMCGDEELGTLKLNVNGYDSYNKCYYEDGEKVTNASREVAGETWYFDKDGNHVTGDAMLTLADGSKIIIINGSLAKGEVSYKGEDGVTRTYWTDANGVVLTGWLTSKHAVTTDATEGVYYADPANDGGLVYKDFATIDGKLYYFNADRKKVTQTTAAFTTLDNNDGYQYYYGANGVITTAALVKVGDKQYLANEKGQKVTYAMTVAAGTAGKYTVGGNVYIIDEDDTAELEDRQYFVSIAWSEWPETFKVADGLNMTATATVYSEKQQKQLTGQEVVVTLSSNSTGLGENNVFYTATADLSKYYADSTYTEKAKNITIEETYIVKDGVATIADKQYFVSIDWSAWPETFKVADGPNMTATATVYSEKQKKQLTGQKVNVTLKSYSTGLEENHVFYEATADLSKYYADSTYTKKAENQVTSETYIEKDGTATKADKKIVTKVSSFSWTPSANKDYKKDTVVTATVTVSYKLEKAGTTGSEVINATVNQMTNSSTKKIEYLAYVNPTGYYKADGTAYDWSKVTATKTYIVNESGEGVSEGITVEELEDEYYYTGVAIKPVVKVTDATADKVLVLGTDYTVKYQNNTKVGTATVIITGKGNYDKQAVRKTFNIVDPMEGETATDYYEVKSVKYDKEDLIYDGTAKAPSKLTIATKEGVTVTATWNGSDYDIAVPDVDGAKTVRVVVANNVNKGSGTIAVYGSKTDRPVKKNFSIKAADMSTLGEKITVNAEAAPYSKKGAKAEVSVTFENGAGETEYLVEGRDYTVKYGYTKKKDAGEKAGNVTITGKNNFSKKATTVASFDIEKLEISESNIIVDAYEKVVPKSLKVKVFDNEREEVSNKYYSITKITKGDEDITNSKDKLVAGDDIYVTVKGDGVNLAEDEVELEVKVGTKLASAKFNAKNLTKTYEGTPIELDDSDLEKVAVTVKINKVETKLVAGEDYEIVGYKNNNKKGNMTVFVKGIGDKVSGYAKFTVKVNAKELKEAE